MIRQSIYETNIKEEDIAFTLTNNKNEKHPNCIIFANDFGINELRKNKNLLIVDALNNAKFIENMNNKIEDILRKIEYQTENNVFSIECRENLDKINSKAFILKIEKTFYLMKKNKCNILFAYVIFPINSEKYHVYYITEKTSEFALEKTRTMIDQINDVLNGNA